MISLNLVIHNHQPVDNDTGIIEKIYKKSYLPFLETVSRHPEIKVTLHYTGYLLSWLEQKYPEFISMLKHMIDIEQVEILGGGFYEPIFTVLPEKDITGQIGYMKNYLGRTFGTYPEGCWLTERVWEPHLPEVLQKCGIKYTFLDDSLFIRGGLESSSCFRPFFTESRGASVTVFPILKRLRYLIPFEDPASTIAFLKKSMYSQNKSIGDRRLAVFADDGEKFGAWPDTYSLVYEKKWLESFFKLIESNKKWLKTASPQQYLKGYGKLTGPIYLPAGSYEEMDRWSLSNRPSSNKSSQRKGFWRMFFSKYQESGRLYSRMLDVSKEIDAYTNYSYKDREKASLTKANSATMELWKSQFNDVYWHGVFGGLYLPELRKTAYTHLINARKILDRMKHKKKGDLEIKRSDSGAISIHSDTFGVYISARGGGIIQEIDFKPKAVNVTDTLTRIKEAYHTEIIDSQSGDRNKNIGSIVTGKQGKIGERNIGRYVVYDKYPRYSFRDYALHQNTEISNFENQSFVEISTLSVQDYLIEDISKQKNDAQCTLSSQSILRLGTSKVKSKFSIRKMILVNELGSSLNVRYLLNPVESKKSTIRGIFASEINLGSLGSPRFIKANERRRVVEKCKNIEINYEELGFSIDFSFSQPASLWIIPVKTVSKSEEGIESKVQGLSLVPHWPIETILRKNLEIGLWFH